jgi:hypothetical protein
MADPVSREQQTMPEAGGQAALPPVAPAETATPAGARQQRRLASIQRRFGLAYLVLAIAVGLSVGLAVVLIGRSDDKQATTPWSGWQPTKSTQSASDQIARHVENRYRLPTGQPLLLAHPRPPIIFSDSSGVPVTTIALRSGFPDRSIEAAYGTDGTLFYYLCGLGKQCAITGDASTERGRLVRLEGLELALYTFKYISDVKSVLTFIPPVAGQSTNALMFFRRSDVQSALDRPARFTLPERSPLKPGQLTPRENRAVTQLTGKHVFQFELQTLPDGSAALVIQPYPT